MQVSAQGLCGGSRRGKNSPTGSTGSHEMGLFPASKGPPEPVEPIFALPKARGKLPDPWEGEKLPNQKYRKSLNRPVFGGPSESGEGHFCPSRCLREDSGSLGEKRPSRKTTLTMATPTKQLGSEPVAGFFESHPCCQMLET
uniref:Uncharacterized protein n=1 Tax=Micrurus corallinus TaxID=54390 RepID=A0A2D4H1E5_MICCO